LKLIAVLVSGEVLGPLTCGPVFVEPFGPRLVGRHAVETRVKQCCGIGMLADFEMDHPDVELEERS
jgi:hypothetical protein